MFIEHAISFEVTRLGLLMMRSSLLAMWCSALLRNEALSNLLNEWCNRLKIRIKKKIEVLRQLQIWVRTSTYWYVCLSPSVILHLIVRSSTIWYDFIFIVCSCDGAPCGTCDELTWKRVGKAVHWNDKGKQTSDPTTASRESSCIKKEVCAPKQMNRSAFKNEENLQTWEW